FIDNRVLWAGKPGLIYADKARQVEAARADVSDFEQQVFTRSVLHAGVVLMEVRRTHVAIKKLSGECGARNEDRKSVPRRHCKERITERCRSKPRPDKVSRRRLDVVEWPARSTRVEDAITTPHNE